VGHFKIFSLDQVSNRGSLAAAVLRSVHSYVTSGFCHCVNVIYSLFGILPSVEWWIRNNVSDHNGPIFTREVGTDRLSETSALNCHFTLR